MCGLLGAIGQIAPATFDGALDRLTHRGPDGRGVYRHASVFLGHRRLSVIDPAGGAQPMLDEPRGLAVVFNGEIYNHLSLRERLTPRGYTFRTTSDTETLLAMYAEYGVECVHQLRGMFAFLIHDARRNVVFGARDPFGKKPLYWRSETSGAVRFAAASEPRALLALWPVERPAISTAGVVSFLRHDYVTAEHSAYDRISRIRPGSAFLLSLDGDSVPTNMKEWSYWSPTPSLSQSRTTPSEADAEARVEALLRNSVERRLLSDVPLGVLLSGGIDSTMIATIASQIVGKGRVKSFSIGFRDPRFDESTYAAEVAQAVGTDHRCRFFDAEDVMSSVDTVLRRLDEPFADPSVLPTAMLCQFARDEVTVALGGDGGDELFAGYDTFAALGPAEVARQLIPAFALRPLDAVAGVLGADSAKTHMPLEFKVRRFLRGFKQRGPSMLTAWQGPFDAPGLERLLPDTNWRQYVAPPSDIMSASSVASALHWYQTVYLPDDILVKGDRASMLHSLEVRSPFLDVDLAEYVNALPDAFKLRGGERKRILRLIIRSWQSKGVQLPDHVLHRPKKGFGIPVATWLRGPLRGRLEETLLHQWPASLGMISKSERERLVREHLSGKRNLWKELWALLVLAWWADAWIQ